MSRKIPAAARKVLDEAVLCHLAVATSHGPHVTPVVFVLDGGRIWVTTARSSVKARAWRRDRAVAGLVESAGLSVAFRGRVRTYDALDPLSWPAAAVAGPQLVRAATRFSLKNARFFAGYAVDARRVPFAWSPPGRLFAGIELLAGRLLRIRTGDVIDGWGEWPGGVRFRASFERPRRARALDLRVPSSVRSAIGSSGRGALALSGPDGLSVLPAWWRRTGAEGSYEAAVPSAFLRLAHPGSGSPAALTVSHASRWRAVEMSGLLLQGPAAAFSPERTTRGGAEVRKRLAAVLAATGGLADAMIELRPRRVVWWQGWTSATVTAR